MTDRFKTQLKTKNYRLQRLLAGGMIAAVSLTGLAACSPEQPDVAGEADVEVEDVAEETDALLGERVTLQGNFVDQLSSATFSLQEDTLFPDDNVLVINATGTDYSVPEDEETGLWVIGTVETFEYEIIADRYELDLDLELYADYEGKPAVIADYIALAPSPETISENPEAFYGQRVVVNGEIDTVFAPDAFSLENEQLFNDQGLLVVGAVPKLAKEDGPVAVSGVLLPFSTENLNNEYDLLWEPDVQKALESEHTGQPAIIVDDIYPFTE
ncbi:MAG: hypothetical protein AAF152_12365 [Cyanobacteria bacterium P01_A01_bin.114]